MKFVLFSLVLSSFSVYSMTEKSPERIDISINDIVKRTCLMSGYFNQLACEDDMIKCYNDYQWPKTVSVDNKIDVVVSCTYSVIRR